MIKPADHPGPWVRFDPPEIHSNHETKTTMTFDEFKKTVRDMRTAQNGYFKTSRTDHNLKQQYLMDSKRLEAQVDKFLREENEPKLF